MRMKKVTLVALRKIPSSWYKLVVRQSSSNSFYQANLNLYKEIHHPNRISADNTLHPWCDVVIPEIPYCQYLWEGLDSFGHLPALICGLTNKTISHGQVSVFLS